MAIIWAVRLMGQGRAEQVANAVQELAQGRTSVFVAHRLSTVQRCDKIVVMADGLVVEQGTHEELMRAGQVYYDMWEAQAAAEEFHEQCVPEQLEAVPLDLLA
jgi:ABC-type transport system involved in cytochrome bd biosynthesis fused ATPase/permease subunit